MSMAKEEIRARILSVRERIARAAERAGRDAGQVTLLGACKQVDRERVLQAIDLGIAHVGENQVQEAEAKFKGWNALTGWPASTSLDIFRPTRRAAQWPCST